MWSQNSAASGLFSMHFGFAENARGLGVMHQEWASEIRAAHDLSVGPCPTCRHEFKSLCPTGWPQAGNGRCLPPATYTGPCAAYLLFDEMSAREKAMFERRCGVCWPCEVPTLQE